MAKIRLTNSRRQCFNRCAREHLWRYERGIRPEVEELALRIGRAVHFGLALHVQGKPDEEVIGEVVSQYISDDPMDAVKVECLLRGYFWRWQDEPLRTALHTEMVFDVPLINPDTGRASRVFTHAGKLDMLDEHGLVEHKTTSEDIDPAADFWLRLRIDSQISGYMLALKRLGLRADRVIYNVIRKPTIKPRQIPGLDADGLKIVRDATGERVYTKQGKPRQSADTAKGYELESREENGEEYAARLLEDIYTRPEFYYQRRQVARTKADLDDAARDLWQTAQIMRQCELHNWWPKNDSACRVFSKCPYFKLCTTGFPMDTGEIPDGYVMLDDVHPELGG